MNYLLENDTISLLLEDSIKAIVKSFSTAIDTVFKDFFSAFLNHDMVKKSAVKKSLRVESLDEFQPTATPVQTPQKNGKGSVFLETFFEFCDDICRQAKLGLSNEKAVEVRECFSLPHSEQFSYEAMSRLREMALKFVNLWTTCSKSP